jgi:hypothetical protein
MRASNGILNCTFRLIRKPGTMAETSIGVSHKSKTGLMEARQILATQMGMTRVTLGQTIDVACHIIKEMYGEDIVTDVEHVDLESMESEHDTEDTSQ